MSTARPARTVGKLDLDPATVRRARALARAAGQPVVELARTHTTVSVERAVLRLAGADRRRRRTASRGSTGWSTRSREQVGLEHGVALPVWDALRRGGHADLRALAAAGGGRVGASSACPEGRDADAARRRRPGAVGRGHRRDRPAAGPSGTGWSRRIGDPPQQPWIYLIVATGDIYEDIPQAQAAAREGADVIAVIRSTGQSLLDYVPEGATREGYAGTYATQENFRLMRAALDDVVAASSAATSG